MILAAAFNETLSTQRTFGDIVAKIKAIFAGLAGVGNDLKPLKRLYLDKVLKIMLKYFLNLFW